jgi:Ran GTPase-activating protein (RanGAP) involved in mRNA processing and transport
MQSVQTQNNIIQQNNQVIVDALADINETLGKYDPKRINEEEEEEDEEEEEKEDETPPPLAPLAPLASAAAPPPPGRGGPK